MKTIFDCDAAGRCRDHKAIDAVAAEFGFLPLRPSELGEARQLASTLLGSGIASLASYETVLREVGAGIYGMREGGVMTALSASFPLSTLGAEKVRDGSFDAVELDPRHLSGTGVTPAGYYGWGFLGATRKGSAKVVLLSRAIHRRLFWATPTYTRAVTADGMRSCFGLGFVAADASQPTLLWIPPNTYQPGPSR